MESKTNAAKAEIDAVYSPERQALAAQVQLERQLAQARAEIETERRKRKIVEAELKDANEANEILEAVSGEPKRYSFTVKSASTKSRATAVLVLTDWHVEERVDPEMVNGLNEYDLEIAKRRVDRAMGKFALMLDASRRLTKIRHLVLACLGDFINGNIHPEYAESNLLSPIEATMYAKDLLASSIDFTIENADVESIDVVCSMGNHSRDTKKWQTSNAYKRSHEWAMYSDLARIYKSESRLRWSISKGYHNLFEIQGRLFRFHHGHAIKSRGGVGGIFPPTLGKINHWNRGVTAPYMDVFGHLHHFVAAIDYGFILCPALVGHNTYCVENGISFTEPGQAYFVVDKDRGITEVKRIFCG